MKRIVWGGLAFVILGWGSAGLCQTDEKKVQRIEPKGLNRIIEYKEPHLLINVASHLECMDARIPGSQCLSCDQEKELGTILPGKKDIKLIFYGGGAPVAAGCRVVEEAVRQGFTRIYGLRGGLPAWKRAGYEIETIHRIPRTPGLAVKPKALADWLKQAHKPLIIDIRDAEVFHKGHLDGAWNLPLSVLHMRYQEIPLDRTLLVVDEEGSRAFLATSYLARKGLAHAARLAGGMNAWAASQRKGSAP